MTLNVLAAHALPISLACNALFAPALVWVLISLRSSRGESTRCEQALTERTAQLRNEEERHSRTQQALKTATDFITALYPLHRQEAGDAADYGERYRYWQKKALLLWAQVREQSAAKQREAKLELGYKIVEAILSYVLPHPTPSCMP
jgi:hypothetical protein